MADVNDVKPRICSHGDTVETCAQPDCGLVEISKILDSLQNFEHTVEGTSPLATDRSVFEFDMTQEGPESPSQWEQWENCSFLPMSNSVPCSQPAISQTLAAPGPATDLAALLQYQPPPQCAGSTGTRLLREGGSPRRAANSPGPAHTPAPAPGLLRCRHPSRSSLSEGYASDHTSVPSPAPTNAQRQVSAFYVYIYSFLLARDPDRSIVRFVPWPFLGW